MTTVVIGTENPQKRDAILEAFKVFFNEEVNVDMINVNSDVPKQPIDAQIIRGAENRIKNMKPLVPWGKYDFFVSVEAGIMRIGKRYYNLQYVLVENTRTGKKSTGISQMIEVPKKYVKFAAKSSINNVFRTIFGDDKVDGLSILTRNEIERKALIKSGAVMALAGQMNGEIW